MTTRTDSTAADSPRFLSPIRDFLATESAGGVLLLAATAIALVWANSPWSSTYESFWNSEFLISIGPLSLEMNLGHVVSEILMTAFFLVVGLEIKREATSGHLSDVKKMALPVIAAIGGMLVPAAIYLAIAGDVAAHGWGVPIATDIALAVGLLTTFGRRVTTSSRVFLLGLAVADDIGGIVVIAIFYSTGVSATWLLVAAFGLVLTIVLRRTRIESVIPFVLTGGLLWLGLYESGVHPTIAGVVMGLLTPIRPKHHTDFVDVDDVADGQSATDSVSIVEWLEHVLHPWASFVIVPLFALSAAGIRISGESIGDALASPISWGIFLGLVLGKPLGALLGVYGSRAMGITELPAGAGFRTMLGVGNAAGIGFTVALFISELAFDDPIHQQDAAMAILAGSTVSAALSSLVVLSRSQRDPGRSTSSA